MACIHQDPIMDKIFAYGSHDLQKIKVFNYTPENNKTYIYIHGGAWRDPNNTFNEMEPVVRDNTHVNHIGINYRLSPKIKHPYHLIDIIKALKFIKENFQVEKIILLGHSVGATMILQLLHFKVIIIDGLENLQENETETETEINELFDFIEKNIQFDQLLFFDGIYDVVELLKEYPDYASFVNDAFVNVNHFQDATQLSSKNSHLDIPFLFINKTTQFIIYQSLEDELLSMKQTKLFIDYLVSRNQKFSLHVGKWGKHEEIYANDRSEVFHGEIPK